MNDKLQEAINVLRAAGDEAGAKAVEELRAEFARTMEQYHAGQRSSYANGRNDERARCEQICAAEQAENRELAKDSKTAMYDWMADGAGLCLGAIRAATPE